MRLFESLTPQDLGKVARFLEVRSYQPQTVIFHMGDQADRLYFLDQGIIKLSVVSPEGVERVVDVMTSGHVFGESFLSEDDRRTATAEALSATTVWTVTTDTFMRLLEALPILCLNFVRHVTDLQRRALRRLIVQLEADTGVRLLAVVLDLAERCGRRTGNDYVLPAELTQSELARMVGANRSTVSLLLNRYRRTGVLGGHGSIIVVRSTPTKALLRRARIIAS